MRALLAACLALGTSVAFALDPDRLLSEYHHQLFSPRGAGVTDVTQVAQTEDGYLWVGTSVGLYRFDGVTFDLMQSLGGRSILHSPVSSVFSEPGGGLWIGFGAGGGVGHYKAGVYTSFNPDQGWTKMYGGVVDGDGATWTAVDHQLFRIVNLVKEIVGADWGVEDAKVHEVVIDKAGTIWASVASGNDLLYLPRGEHRFRSLGQDVRGRLLAVTPDGTVFVSGPRGITAVTTRAGLPERVVKITDQAAGRILGDHGGGLIIALPQGLAHVGSVRTVLEPRGGEALTRDVLKLSYGPQESQEVVYSLAEDRDDNVWVATGTGLHRIRDTRLTPLTIPGAAFTFSVVPGADGAVWASNWYQGLIKVEHRTTFSVVRNVGTQVSALYRDRNGVVWVGSPSGVWRENPQQAFAPVAVPVALLQPLPQNMALDAANELWFSSANIVRGSPERADWRKLSTQDGFGERSTEWALMSDSVGRIWTATGTEISRVDNGKAQRLDALSAKVKVGGILTFAERNGHLWIGGLEGLALVRGDVVVHLRTRSGASFNQVVGVLETAQGDLWVRGADDAWRVLADELRSALSNGRTEVEAEHFDVLDGLTGLSIRPKPVMAEASDGVIWFGTHQGLAWFDPSRPRRPTPTPPGRIQAVRVDGRIVDSSSNVEVPALARHVEISYTAIDLGYPERIQFRYKMDGIDRDWQVAGTRRVAYYNDLPPGDYHFSFAATDRDGHWHEESGPPLSLHVVPSWTQTAWFKLGVALAVILLATLAYRLRMLYVAKGLRAQLRRQMTERDRILVTRQAERERIARELHDTLIQSTQGLIYLFQGLTERISLDDRTRAQLESALVRANEVAAEGRDRIEDLRETTKIATDLPRALAALGGEALAQTDIQFRTIVTGAAREIGPGVIDAISWIGREALVNAARHSHASSVEIEIAHEDDVLMVAIRDDGVGLPEEILIANTPGHWGILGMRERAASIDADIKFRPLKGGGTEVRLTTPGTVAYGDMTGRFRWRSFERRSRSS